MLKKLAARPTTATAMWTNTTANAGPRRAGRRRRAGIGGALCGGGGGASRGLALAIAVVHRYLRLTPLVGLAILVMIYLVPLAGTGRSP